MMTVHLIEELQLALLAIVRDMAGPFEMCDRRIGSEDGRTLVGRRHETRRPIPRAIDDVPLTIFHHHEGWEILVLGTESVSNPTSQGGPTTKDRTGVHLANAVGMIEPIAPARANDAEVIGVLRNMREPVRNPQTAVAMLLPFPPTCHQRSVVFAHRCNDRCETIRQRLASEFLQGGFGSKRSI